VNIYIFKELLVLTICYAMLCIFNIVPRVSLKIKFLHIFNNLGIIKTSKSVLVDFDMRDATNQRLQP
jgi:hypothetical protein